MRGVSLQRIDLDEFQRDVMYLLRFSLEHPAGAAPVLFPMFEAVAIESLYAIPLERRERIWRNRDLPEYRDLIDQVRENEA